MKTYQTRRDFIRTSTAGAALLAGGTLLRGADAQPPALKAASATDKVTVGKTGVTASFLAQGTGYNGGARSSDHTRMGKEAFAKLLRRGMDQGVRFIDTADLYGTHTFIRDIIGGTKRESFAVLSKIWPDVTKWNQASGGAREEVDRFRKELGIDMLDIVLIHCMQNAQWPEKYERIRDELSQLKEKQAIRAVGVSCHNLNALKVASEHPWVDVIFARINNAGAVMDGPVEQVAPVLKTARANGKFVVGMKIYGAGKLVKPEEKDASLKYVISNRLVDAMTIGAKTTDEVDDNVSRINKAFKAV